MVKNLKKRDLERVKSPHFTLLLHRFKYDLIDKLDFKSPNKNMALTKISAPTWNETFDLPDGSYNIPAIQTYLEYIIKIHENIADTAPILIYANRVVNE